MGINEESASAPVSMGEPLFWPEFRARVIELLDVEGEKLQAGVDVGPYEYRTWWGYPATIRLEFPMGILLNVVGPLTLRRESRVEASDGSDADPLPVGVGRHKYLDGEELRKIAVDAEAPDV
jgi:hypothetical protein